MKAIILLIGLLTVFTEAAWAEPLPPCQASYLAGVEHFEQGEFQAAAESFSRAIEFAPGPETGPDEYLPHIYLAASSFEVGWNRLARDALVKSQVYGVAPVTETGSALIDQYAARIMSASLDGPEFASVPLSSPVITEPFSLTENEVEIIKAQVLRRCSLSNKIEDNKLPWYFHYEFGVDLMEAGDANRALNSFVLGANVREDPRRGKRMYGMWYVDYLPYYQIALAHTQLGEWKNAQAAIQTSLNLGEFSPGDPDWEQYTALEQLIEEKIKAQDS
jgi:tetratricopeptide (TPR) repeat protein